MTFIDFYFYPKKVEINFGKNENTSFIEPRVKNIMLYKSNAEFFDRIYLSYKILTQKKSNLTTLQSFERLNENKDLVFDSSRFEETYDGLFYQQTYRNERKSVQILYTNDYTSAFIIGQILENNGIRVVDISRTQEADNTCNISERERKSSKTSINLGLFFQCKVSSHATTTISDIIFNLGSIEKEWSSKLN